MKTAATQHANPVSRFITEVINQNDCSEFKQLIAPHYKYKSGNLTLKGRDELRTLLNNYRAAFPDIHIHIDEQIHDNRRNDLVIMRPETSRVCSHVPYPFYDS